MGDFVGDDMFGRSARDAATILEACDDILTSETLLLLIGDAAMCRFLSDSSVTVERPAGLQDSGSKR